MNFSLILISSGVWIFIFRKLTSWNWFGRLKSSFPLPLNSLWQGWTECAYCGGFWIALIIRALTSLHTVTFPTAVVPVIAWPLDAIGTAVGILLVVKVLDALSAFAQFAQTGQKLD